MIRILTDVIGGYTTRPALSDEMTAHHVYRAQYYNDEQSVITLIEANMKWAKTYTKQFADSREIYGQKNELLSAAVLALLDAIYNFDPEADTKFLSYANYRMDYRLSQALHEMLSESGPRIPRSAVAIIVQANKKQAEMEKELQRFVPLDEVCDAIETTDHMRDAVVQKSIRQIIPYRSADANLEEVIPANQPAIDDEINDAQCVTMIDRALDRIPAQAYYILSANPGDNLSTDGSTLRSLAETMGISHEYVRHLRERAKQTLYRQHLKKGNYFDNRKN